MLRNSLGDWVTAYRPSNKKIGLGGFEPPTPCIQAKVQSEISINELKSYLAIRRYEVRGDTVSRVHPILYQHQGEADHCMITATGGVAPS